MKYPQSTARGRHLIRRGDEERHRHEQALNQVGHALLKHDVARAGLGSVLTNAHERARVHGRLRQDAVGRGKAEETEEQRVDALEQEIVVIRRGFLQPEIVRLRKLRGHVMVEEEEHGDDDGRDDGRADLRPGDSKRAPSSSTYP